MGEKPTLTKNCKSCLKFWKVESRPSLDNVVPNAERFAAPYAIAGVTVLVVCTFLSSWFAFLPVVSLLFLLLVLHYQSDKGLTWIVGGAVAVPHVVFVVVMWLVVGGNYLRPALVCVLGLAAGVAHASYRQPRKKREGSGDIEMARVAESPLSGPRGNEESVLEEFRRHSESVKQKYGL